MGKNNFNLLSFFEKYDCLVVTVIAQRCNINESLMRQYSSGMKEPSMKRKKEIEKVIHQLGEELKQIHLL